jgi:hypothetical protein
LAAPPVRFTVHRSPTQVVNVTVNDQGYGYSSGASEVVYIVAEKPETEADIKQSGLDPNSK